MINKIALFLLIILGVGSKLYAGDSNTIVATVNDEVISAFDLKDRLDLAIFSAGLQDSPDIRSKLRSQLLELLIDETLYRQEGKKLGIESDPTELIASIADLEKKNKLEPGTMRSFFKEHNVNYSSFVEKVKSDLLWRNIIMHSIKSKVNVSEREVDEKIEYIHKNNAGISELNLSEITLPITKDATESKVLELADKLIKEINNGKDFAEIARQFSQSPSASSGGDLGWVPQNQIAPTISQVLLPLTIGNISNPVKIGDGYSIYKLNDKRALIAASNEEEEYGIKQAFIKLPENVSEENAAKILGKINQRKNKVSSCENFDAFAKDINSVVSPEVTVLQLRQLHPSIAEAISKAKIGQTTPLVQTNEGVFVFMVCEKISPQISIATRNKIRNSLYQQKLELAVKNYLQNLKRNAYIEIRK